MSCCRIATWWTRELCWLELVKVVHPCQTWGRKKRDNPSTSLSSFSLDFFDFLAQMIMWEWMVTQSSTLVCGFTGGEEDLYWFWPWSSKCQGHRFYKENFLCWIVWVEKSPIHFGCGPSRVKVTVTIIQFPCPHHNWNNDRTKLKLSMCVMQEDMQNLKRIDFGHGQWNVKVTVTKNIISLPGS